LGTKQAPRGPAKSTQRPALKRLQHSGFGKEIRALLAANRVKDRELAGIVINELEHMAAEKAAGRSHSCEDRLEGDVLGSISYLRLYKEGSSIRPYFVVIDSVIWMLHLDAGKRKTKLSAGTAATLKQRLSEVKEAINDRKKKESR
jgi:hypothetical protein